MISSQMWFLHLQLALSSLRSGKLPDGRSTASQEMCQACIPSTVFIYHDNNRLVVDDTWQAVTFIKEAILHGHLRCRGDVGNATVCGSVSSIARLSKDPDPRLNTKNGVHRYLPICAQQGQTNHSRLPGL
jgi:hypothetical protein